MSASTPAVPDPQNASPSLSQQQQQRTPTSTSTTVAFCATGTAAISTATRKDTHNNESSITRKTHHESAKLRSRRARSRWTHTNSDKECLQANAGFLRRWVYVIDTHNGFKFFNLAERTACHVVAWLGLAVVLTYNLFFLKGLWDGFSAIPAPTTPFASTYASTHESSTEL